MTAPVPSPAMAPAHSTAGPASVATSVQTIGLLGTSCGLAASAGTAARAATMRDNTAIIPNFLNIWVFLLCLVGLYCSLRARMHLLHRLRAVECLFAGAGRSCKGVHSQNKRPALANLVSPQQTLQHHLHSLRPRSNDKTDYLLCIRR